MIWDHEKKLKQLALQSMNRSGIHRPVKVVPHQPGRPPALRVRGWVSQEKFIMGKTPEEVERILGFDGRPGQQYLPHGFDVYVITEQIRDGDFDLKRRLYLSAGRSWLGQARLEMAAWVGCDTMGAQAGGCLPVHQDGATRATVLRGARAPRIAGA